MGLPGRLIFVVLSDSIVSSSQCKAEGPSNALVEVEAVLGLSEELEGVDEPLNAVFILSITEAILGLSKRFTDVDGPLNGWWNADGVEVAAVGCVVGTSSKTVMISSSTSRSLHMFS